MERQWEAYETKTECPREIDMKSSRNAAAPGTGERKDPIFPLRTVVLGAFVPTLLFEVGLGALIPIIPALTTIAGGNLTHAALIAALIPVGKILFDLPAGALSARVGDRVAMMVAGTMAVGSYLVAVLAGNLVGLAGGVFAVGAASAVYNLARQAYLTEVTPPLQRARVMSTLGGFHRIGLFIGPFAGAGLIALFGVGSVLWLGIGSAGATVLLLSLLGADTAGVPRRSRGAGAGSARGRATAPGQLSAWRLALLHRGLFARMGTAILLVSAVRGARQNVIPLWAEHIGLHESTTSLIVGIAGGLDMVLFYPAGKVMDRFGRLWVAVPSMALMALGTALVPLTGTAAGLGCVAGILGVANGVGSGIVMTLGADMAPPDQRSRFLSVWRLFQDTGDAAGPLLLSAGAAAGSLAAGIIAAACTGAWRRGRWRSGFPGTRPLPTCARPLVRRTRFAGADVRAASVARTTRAWTRGPVCPKMVRARRA
ncbi:putative MFS family arabinose efflux permease [Rarobacter incanus]|uniref:Putative MFS family arabinose efflux permease n=2 Tax=Rarobacter incanus TaxID=153494 RepID=A0A542SQ73_9MICO|nr:putative MFS family arabinose efflux permease [Rarobacter incanus]